MPIKPRKPCNEPGCPNLTNAKCCEYHARQHIQDRGNSSQRGYDNRWRKASKRYLSVHPLCTSCHKEGRLTKATVVDHVKPHRGNKTLFWDVNNWQALCKSCHDKKTMTEDRYQEFNY
jgi:5-methylcytosine-specific restriction protein A